MISQKYHAGMTRAPLPLKHHPDVYLDITFKHEAVYFFDVILCVGCD